MSLPPWRRPMADRVLIADEAVMDAAVDRRGRLAPPLYLGLLALAELAVLNGPPGLGVAALASLLLALQLHSALSDERPLADLLFVLALAPLVRLMALALEHPELPPLTWGAGVAAAIFLAALRGAHELQLRPSAIGLRPGGALTQLGIALIALPLSLVLFLVLQPGATGAPAGWQSLLPAMATIFGLALAQELLFRGVMLRAARQSIGVGANLFAAAIFAILHLGYGSPLLILVAFGAALLFGRLVERTGSLVGVVLANGGSLALAFFVWPRLSPVLEQPADLRPLVELMAQGALVILATLLLGRWLLSLWHGRRSAAEARSLRRWAAEVGRLVAGGDQAALDAAARALCARLSPQQLLVVELDALRARTVVRVSLGATGRRLHGPEGLEAPWAAFARLVDIEALGPQLVARHPFSLNEGPYLVMPLGAGGRWAVIRPRPGHEAETRRRLAALVGA